jgi:hypothetical protein
MNKSVPPPADPSPNENVVFGPLRLVREIGRGGMGTVHLAEVLDPWLAESGD